MYANPRPNTSGLSKTNSVGSVLYSSRRALARTSIALTTALLLAGAVHAEYPERLTKWVVPAAAGSGVDAAVRIVPDQPGRRWLPVVDGNRLGAIKDIEVNAIAKRTPYGYAVGGANLVLDSQLHSNLPVSSDSEQVSVWWLTTHSGVLVVNRSSHVMDVHEFDTFYAPDPLDAAAFEEKKEHWGATIHRANIKAY